MSSLSELATMAAKTINKNYPVSKAKGPLTDVVFIVFC